MTRYTSEAGRHAGRVDEDSYSHLVWCPPHGDMSERTGWCPCLREDLRPDDWNPEADWPDVDRSAG